MIKISQQTLDTVERISNTKRDARQAAGILKHNIKSSMKKVRILEQLWFMKALIANNLATKRIVDSSSRLELSPSQTKKITKNDDGKHKEQTA